MSLLIATLRRVIGDLDEIGRRWALVGGLAVSARAEPRTTRDIDLVVFVTDDRDAEGVVFAFQQLGYSLDSALQHMASKRLATARLRPPERGVLVDLMFASSGIEDEIVAAASGLEILPGVRIPVASTAHLIAMKVLARDDRDRPQDWADRATRVPSSTRSRFIARSCDRRRGSRRSQPSNTKIVRRRGAVRAWSRSRW